MITREQEVARRIKAEKKLQEFKAAIMEILDQAYLDHSAIKGIQKIIKLTGWKEPK